MRASLIALAVAAAGLAAPVPAMAQAPRAVAAVEPAGATPLVGEVALSTRQFAQLVAARNPEIRYSRMGVEVAGALKGAEASLYEPILFGNLRGSDISRQRTVEERLASAALLSVLDERDRTGEAGIRQRLPTAGEVALSYRILRRRTNLIAAASGDVNDTEWTGALILTYKQPLLRNRGRSVLETDRRVAELEQQVQWAQFRQQVLKTTADSLNLYWQLERALGALQMRQDALGNVRRIARDVDGRIQAGRAPPANQLEVESTVVARQADLTRAEQAVREVETRMLTALSLSDASAQSIRLRTVQEPLPRAADVEPLAKVVDRALTQWPPYLVSQLKLQQGRVRLDYARNQRQPQLDLTASYTGNGLSYSRIDARQLAFNDRYPEWAVGLNFEMPIGNGRADGQYDAQAVRVQQGELELDAIRTSLSNDLGQRRDELQASLLLAAQMQQDVDLRGKLVDSDRERYKLGVGQLSQWLLRENELLEARQRLAEAEMRARQARVAWLFAQGSLLDEYDIALRNE